ncbi:hypothetical protein [Haloplanus halophilus]|uniref:hypothetical protein n=1 Tax=Haloplanus halophilus TaxID=2949993 RepID=UPI00203B560E|nr:hypothetical protein [Haloplanus sp. GDY1]
MRNAVVVAAVLVVAGVASLGPVAAQSQAESPPSVTVTVDGAPLALGEVHHTSADPWLSVSATAPEGETIRLVEIRVDGETRHVFEPSTRTVERNLVLDLRNGDHRITVVARAGDVTTYSATVVRDDRAPSVTFAPPLRGGPVGYDTETLDRLDGRTPLFVVDETPTSTATDAVPELTVANSTLTVAGTIDDHSAIRAVRIDHAYEYAPVGGRSADDDEEFAYDPVDTAPIHPALSIPTDGVDDDADPERLDRHLLPSPGDSFNETVTLALGSNYLRVAVEDVLGNVAVYHVVVTVDDGTPPTVNVTDVRYVSPTRLHVEGTVSDSVQVHDVWVDETVLTLDEVATDVDIESLDGRNLCAATTELEIDDEEELCSVYDEATVQVREDENELVVRHRVVYRQPTVPDADRKRVGFDTTVYHPAGADSVTVGANDTALNERLRTYALSTFLAPNITIGDRGTGYVEGRTVSVTGRIAGGQVAGASVETLDPDTGRIVDIRPVDVGADGSFGTRLEGARDETRVRVRVRDASGEEYLNETTVTAPAEDPAPTASEADPRPTPLPAPGDGDGDADVPDDEAPAGFRIPILGVVVPIPDPLGASVSVPVPVVGPFDVPLVPVGGLALLAAVVAVRRR